MRDALLIVTVRRVNYLKAPLIVDALQRLKGKNIAFVITRSDVIGGAQEHVVNLGVAFRAHGVGVTIVAGGNGVLRERVMASGLSYHGLTHLSRSIRPLQEIRSLYELAEVLRMRKPDIVSAHSSKAGWLSRIVGRKLGIPVVFTAHGWSFTVGLPPFKRVLHYGLERSTSGLVSHVINVSRFDYELALRSHILPASRMTVVHNGVPDVEACDIADPTCEPPRIIMVARLDYPKDPFSLLRALAPIQHLPWEVEFIGDGPMRPAAEEIAGALGMSNRVYFRGASHNVAGDLSRGSVFALISRYEAFPRTILEAMRARLPVVASDVGGVREAVTDNETGFLVGRGEIQLLTRQLTILLRNPSLRLRLGEAGRARYQQSFTMEHCVRETALVLADALNKGC